MRPRLLDLFCGSGGAAMGYSRAGFDVFGVDLAPKPLRHYPFPHVCADALEYLAAHGHEYDAIHASPPCQGYSIMHNLPWLRGRDYPLLILPTLEILERIGKPYVLENVMGARHGAKGLTARGLEAHGLKAGWLCGLMFGKPFYRHRLFASNWFWLAPGHPKHQFRIRPGHSLAGRARDIVFIPTRSGNVDPNWRETQKAIPTLANWQGNGVQADGVGVGHARGWRLAAEAMGIDWMTGAELSQAIPPCYSEWLGGQLRKHLDGPNATGRGRGPAERQSGALA